MRCVVNRLDSAKEPSSIIRNGTAVRRCLSLSSVNIKDAMQCTRLHGLFDHHAEPFRWLFLSKRRKALDTMHKWFRCRFG